MKIERLPRTIPRPHCEVIIQPTRWGSVLRRRRGEDENVCCQPASFKVADRIIMCHRHAADLALREALDPSPAPVSR